MARGIAYTRKMRAKHIKRKKDIIHKVYPWLGEWYKHDGQYSKGKIHCSCPLCSYKAYIGKHVPTWQEAKRIDAMQRELEEAMSIKINKKCYQECPIGIMRYHKFLQDAESVFYAVDDFVDFTEHCTNCENLVPLQELKDNGSFTVYTLDEFRAVAKQLVGVGYWCTNTYISAYEVKDLEPPVPEFTKVLWFNQRNENELIKEEEMER